MYGGADDGPDGDDDSRGEGRRGEERRVEDYLLYGGQTGLCPQGVSQSPVICALSHQPDVSHLSHPPLSHFNIFNKSSS